MNLYQICHRAAVDILSTDLKPEETVSQYDSKVIEDAVTALTTRLWILQGELARRRASNATT